MSQAVPPKFQRGPAPADVAAPAREKPAAWKRALPWLITLVCFAYLYSRIAGQAAREGETVAAFMVRIFQDVSWLRWLGLMIPYSAFFFLIDSAVVWRIINWFNTRIRYADILPIRGSAYIISILNEQVGKGAMAVYLNRRDGVPGWQVGSSMLFIMFCEFFYLLFWATVGVTLQWDHVPPVFHSIPAIAVGASIFFAAWVLYFRGKLAPGLELRDRQIFHAFRQANAWHYLGVMAIRSPALLMAVVVYTLAMRLFGVEVGFYQVMGFLPVIFFGTTIPGPFRAVAITMWAWLFPENPGEMAAFGLVQHNFFILFNAAIGLLFLRRANREIFG